MREIVSINKFFLTIKAPCVIIILIINSISFLGDSLMTPPRYPKYSLFTYPLLLDIIRLIKYKPEIILQVFIGYNLHSVLAPKISLFLDLYFILIITFITLSAQYYFSFFLAIFMDLMPEDQFFISLFQLENLVPRNFTFFSLDFCCANLQINIIGTFIYYFSQKSKNRSNFMLKIACLCFIIKFFIRYDLPFYTIGCTGNLLIGMVAAESQQPYNTDYTSQINTIISPYKNIYISCFGGIIESKFRSIYCSLLLLLPFFVQFGAYYSSGKIQQFIDSLSQVLTAICFSTIICFFNQTKEQQQKPLNIFLQTMRKIDRALILVQQPIYTFVLFKFRVVQLGPYNTTIMLLLYVGVLGITVITGYVTSWLLEDVVFKANIFLMKKQLKLKQDYLIHLALSKTSHKSVES